MNFRGKDVRELSGGMSGENVRGMCGSSCSITSRLVWRLWLLPPWLTHRHT